MLPPISAPWLPPNIAIQPAANHPTNGMPDTAGAAAAPTLVPTSLPDCSPPPTAFIHASVLAIDFPSASAVPPPFG